LKIEVKKEENIVATFTLEVMACHQEILIVLQVYQHLFVLEKQKPAPKALMLESLLN